MLNEVGLAPPVIHPKQKLHAANPHSAPEDVPVPVEAGLHPQPQAVSEQPPGWSQFSPQATGAQALDLDAGPLMSGWTAAKLTLDAVGTVEPSPLADGASGLMSLAELDFVGVAGSAASATVPYAGDAVAKPLKVVHELARCFDWADRVGGDKLLHTIVAAANTHDLLAVPHAMRSLDNVHKAADEAYKKPETLKLAKDAGLPIDGPLPFAPPENFAAQVQASKTGPFADAFGNHWFAPKPGAPEPAFQVHLAAKSGLSSFASVENGPIYVDARGLPVQPEQEETVGHLARVTVPASARKA